MGYSMGKFSLHLLHLVLIFSGISERKWRCIIKFIGWYVMKQGGQGMREVQEHGMVAPNKLHIRTMNHLYVYSICTYNLYGQSAMAGRGWKAILPQIFPNKINSE
jgi:hypothetical protein